MPNRRVRLSKSRLVAYRQCPKRLWLQTFRRELGQRTEAVENRMAQGNLVGAVAQRLYPGGRLIGHVDDLTAALNETRAALGQPGDVTLFEPALRCKDILVRADVLIRRDRGYRMIEVKASTKVKDYHVTDAAIQTWVARGAGLDIERVELAHIDTRFVYQGDGDYNGLFAHADMTDAVLPLQDQIPLWLADAQRDLAGPMPETPVGKHCHDPFECEFMAFCAPGIGRVSGRTCCRTARGSRRRCAAKASPTCATCRSIVSRATTTSASGASPFAAPPNSTRPRPEKSRTLPWPRWFLDFETVGPAVPLWKGTRPYQKIPMQWSCHREDEDGTVSELPPFLTPPAPTRAAPLRKAWWQHRRQRSASWSTTPPSSAAC